MTTKHKILTLQNALAAARKASLAGKKTVFTNGCFDLVHSGHVSLLEKSRSLGGFLIVGLNSDASVRRLKGASRPLNRLKDRARVLAALAAVDLVVPFAADTPYELIRALKPDILVKGADYARREIVGREFAGRTVRISLVKGRSTSGLIKKINGGNSADRGSIAP
ncbi:MAG: adenylyltransferase/cytidyltransferase family protein [Elusimicrobiales bacterium]|jgi:D-beta-D-heptose 7-phosphate kinase/D-beta-D-heptose 1-phosphate adenosyltransferase